jgi:tRNA pseudouridine55 synthase
LNRVLVIDKPSGMTSHDVVARVRRSTKIRKVGHAGTLDPDATGVLVVLVGKATRLAQFLVELPKRYRGRVILGSSTDTQDSTGEVVSTGDTSNLTREQVEQAFVSFEGESEQVPPMVSALKRDGTPLYVLARRGEVVEREARPIVIRDLRVLAVEMPEVEFELECSKGTYVRTVAADLGDKLGCGGHLGRLVRTAVGHFSLDDACSLEDVDRAGPGGGGLGFSMLDALSFMPELRITDREEDVVSTGGSIEVSSDRLAPDAEFVRMTVDGEELAAVGRLTNPEDGDAGGSRVRPVRVFVDPV